MAFTKIKEEELVGKGVVGLPDRPSLSTLDMQKKFDELSRDVIIPKFNRFLEELEFSILDTSAEVEANEEEKKIAGALALKEIFGTADISAIGDGTVKGAIKEHDSKFLPLTGGTLNGGLEVYGGRGTLWAFSQGTGISATPDISKPNFGKQLVLTNQNYSAADHILKSLLIRITREDNTLEREYMVFGQHNKPSGSYIGNGSATERNINIGGIGNALLLHCDNSGTVIITCDGGLYFGAGNLSAISYGNTHFYNGVLYIASELLSLNGNGFKYEYTVI